MGVCATAEKSNSIVWVHITVGVMCSLNFFFDASFFKISQFFFHECACHLKRCDKNNTLWLQGGWIKCDLQIFAKFFMTLTICDVVTFVWMNFMYCIVVLFNVVFIVTVDDGSDSRNRIYTYIRNQQKNIGIKE